MLRDGARSDTDSSGPRRRAGRETTRDLFHIEDIDVGREIIVDLHADDFGSQHRFDVDVRNLAERMHTGVGASGSLHLDPGGIEHLLGGVQQFALYRPGVLLHLPATVARAFVFYVQLESGHKMHGGIT